jgi:FMN phosphatase YigB (HAD superfamily)
VRTSRSRRAVVFDVGSTLIHPNPDVLRAALAHVDGLEACTDADLLGALVLSCDAPGQALPAGRTADEKVAISLSSLLELDREAVIEGWRDAVASPDLYAVVDESARGALEDLRDRGVRLGVASNSRASVPDALDAAGLTEFFDAVVQSSVVDAWKPDPAIFAAAAASLDIDEGSCCYVGDSVLCDFFASRCAGFGMSILYDRYGVHTRRPGLESVATLMDVAPRLEDAWR